MQSNPVVWFEIYVRDMPRAKAFYEAVLGISLQKLENPASGVSEIFTFPMWDGQVGASGALMKMDGGPSSSGNSTIVYFSCEDCATEAMRVPDAGGKVMKEKFAIGAHGFIALITDPEGNVIGLHSSR